MTVETFSNDAPLLRITGFFRNDQPYGLAFSFEGSPEVLKQTATEISKAIKHFTQECSDEDLLEWLEEACERRATLTDQERVGAMAMITILIHHRVIKSNDHNGTLYLALKRRTMICYEDLAMAIAD